MQRKLPLLSPLRSSLLALAGATLMSACAPLVIGTAAVGGALMYSDRRTSGAQVDDQAIELKAAGRIRDVAPGSHVSVTSYNRLVLLTGEVASDEQRAAVERTAAAVESVRGVVNEAAVMGNSALSERSSDAVLLGQVKTRLVNAPDLQAHAIKVVVERGAVYLMGRVTAREADRAVELARTVGGVQKVVRVFELLSEDELKALGPSTAQTSPVEPPASAPPSGSY